MAKRISRAIVAIFVGLIITAGLNSVTAEVWKPIVLKASSINDDGAGNVVIRLSSGKTITIPKADWSSQWSEAVLEALKRQEAERRATSSAEPPSDQGAAASIRTKCAKEWPDDFAMRKYCENKQYDGLRALRARPMTGPLARIRAKCAGEWPDDFTMRNYCEKKQLEALSELNR